MIKFVLTLICLAASPAGLSAEAVPGGVVVESVATSFAAHRAGLEPGDLLLSWERAAAPPANPQAARGEFRWPFDVDEVEIEQTPRGELVISAVRDGESFTVRMPPGLWRLATRPRMAETRRRPYLEGKRLLGTAAAEQGLARWRDLALSFRDSGEHQAASWMYSKIASFYAEHREAAEHQDREAARTAFEDAIWEAELSGKALPKALLKFGLAKSFERWGERAQASAHDHAALEILRRLSPSLTAARVFNHLGSLAWYREDLVEAEEYYRQALTIRRQLAPESIDVANSYHNLAIVAQTRGDLAEAEERYRHAWQIDEKLYIEGPEVVSRLNNLGTLLSQRGDLVRAEAVLRQALAAQEKLAPQNQMIRLVFNALGNVAHSRGDLEAAEAYYRRSLETGGKDPSEFRNALVFSHLGRVALGRADLALAEKYFRQAFALMQRVKPESLEVAGMFNSLGEVAFRRGDIAAAEADHYRALELQWKISKVHPKAARSLHLLGIMARHRGDLSAAEGHFQQALAIREQTAPGSLAAAESSHSLGSVYRRMRQPIRALPFFRRAVETLDAQKESLGGSDGVETRFAAHYAGFYHDYLEALLELGDSERAFGVLERYRARGFLALLAERDLTFRADIPAELDRERRLANAYYDRAFRELSRQTSDSETRRDELGKNLQEARLRQTEVAAKIRLASPRLGSLKYPRPLDLSATWAALDPGTLLLSYAIGPKSSYLFAVGPLKGELEVFSLALDNKSLGREVERFRQALERGRLDPRTEIAWLYAGKLSERLLVPAAGPIARAERLLIVADGPLHVLPFAALADPARPGERRFLVESKPVYTAASATVFAQLKSERRPRSEIRLTAFGDPEYPADDPPEEPAALELRVILRSGFRLPRLPATRTEVENLRRLYPQTSRIYLGAEATEAKAKTIGRDAEILHFACHGLLDDRSPLDSALALTIPRQWREGEDNGLLQVWEIFEQVRIDADLVTLSACDTGLGRVVAGEGLLGLSRAFQYAGARSVLASLWSLSDLSTAELMTRFYRYLKAGQSKAEALRRAQVDLLHESSFSHPFHWAGFQLIGDWQ